MINWSLLPASMFASNINYKSTTYRSKKLKTEQYGEYAKPTGEYTKPTGEFFSCNCAACFPPLPKEMVMPQLPPSRDKSQILSEPKPNRQYPFGVVSDAYSAPPLQNPHRSTWAKYQRSANRIIPIFKSMGIDSSQGKSRTDRAIRNRLTVLDKGYISFSFSAKTRPRLSGRPRPPRPIRPGRGSQDKPGRSTNKRPEPNTTSSKHRGHRLFYKCPAPVQNAQKHRTQAISGQHHHWTQVACPSRKIRPITACMGWGGCCKVTPFPSRKRAKKKPIGHTPKTTHNCSFFLRFLQLIQTEAKFYWLVPYPKKQTNQNIIQPKLFLNKVPTKFIHSMNKFVIPQTNILKPFLSLKALPQ